MTEDGVGDYINLLSLRQLAEIQRLLQWHTEYIGSQQRNKLWRIHQKI